MLLLKISDVEEQAIKLHKSAAIVSVNPKATISYDLVETTKERIRLKRIQLREEMKRLEEIERGVENVLYNPRMLAAIK